MKWIVYYLVLFITHFQQNVSMIVNTVVIVCKNTYMCIKFVKFSTARRTRDLLYSQILNILYIIDQSKAKDALRHWQPVKASRWRTISLFTGAWYRLLIKCRKRKYQRRGRKGRRSQQRRRKKLQLLEILWHHLTYLRHLNLENRWEGIRIEYSKTWDSLKPSYCQLFQYLF